MKKILFALLLIALLFGCTASNTSFKDKASEQKQPTGLEEDGKALSAGEDLNQPALKEKESPETVEDIAGGLDDFLDELESVREDIG